MYFIDIILLIILALMLVFFIVVLFKNNNTCKNQLIILDAIYDFHIAEIKRTNGKSSGSEIVDFKDMESYDNTLKTLVGLVL